MDFRTLAALSLLLVPMTASGATAVDSTLWLIGGTDKAKFPKHKAASTPVAGIILHFANDGTFTIANSAIATYGGTFAAKGKRGVRFTLDAPTLGLYQDFLVQGLGTVAGATNVSVLKFTAKSAGAVSKDGQTFGFATHAKMRVSATIAGRTKKLTVTDNGKYSGPKTS